jgi:hypothetical protein
MIAILSIWGSKYHANLTKKFVAIDMGGDTQSVVVCKYVVVNI